MSDEILYHPDIFIPAWFKMPTGRAHLKYSKHALYACNTDRYGSIPVFESIPLSRFTLVELGVVDSSKNQFRFAGKRLVSKIVVRGKFDEKRDVIFVLIPRDGHYFVKTCWMNMRSDTHRTLREDRYATA